MHKYTVKLHAPEVADEYPRGGRLASPEGMMGRIPRYVFYVPALDIFVSEAHHASTGHESYITTIYPLNFAHERSLIKEIEDFHRKNNPELRR
jgi:hypothetical protein